MALSCIISEIKRHIGRRSRLIFFHTPLHLTPPLAGGGCRPNIVIPFGIEKLEWRGYTMVKKLKIHLAVSTEHRHVTDRRTDGRTDGETGILIATAQSALCIASRGENETTEMSQY